MKLKNILSLSLILGLILTSCEKDVEIPVNSIKENSSTAISKNPEIEIESFVYRGLNEIYLYKEQVEELADNYFESANDKNEFLASASSPEALFKDLTSESDRFSFITDDYKSLEDRLQGISGATGIKYGLGQISGSNNIFGIIRYILPGSSAEAAGLERGNIFTEVNGQKLTATNFSNLIDQGNITINVGYVEDGQIILTSEKVNLTDESYTENPVYIAKTFDVSGRKIGYLMYNSFLSNFDEQLNAVFGDFKADGITDLILDLRYNGGGSVESAKDLASMITGQFREEVFIKEQWNAKYQNFYQTQNPEALVNRFDDKLRTGTSINSLHLTELYVLTSGSTASASELIINGLDPYINVIQIGATTVGKFQASVTLYDSENFTREGASTNHTYAMQPLVFKSINSAGRTDYLNGLDPEITYTENLNEMGVLGELSEPLLETAVNAILGRSKKTKSTMQGLDFKLLGESGMNDVSYQRMYIEKLPALME